MAQSLSKIYIHLVFHIKNMSPLIREEDLGRVHSYIGSLVNATGCKAMLVGGVCDHVHLLFLLSKDASVSHVAEDVKRNSSRWIKGTDACYRAFSWQNGYAAFSVSQSVVEKTLAYIKEQRQHHKKTTFQEEYRMFLQSYGISFNEEYVFRD